MKQIFGIALASAYASKNKNAVNYVSDEASGHLLPHEKEAAKAAAAIMAMNNQYYRFTHLSNDKSYAAMPAKLRMNIIANPGIPKIDFELNCLAVSVINGCGMCIDAHANELIKAGLSKLAIQSTARIAAVIHSAAFTLGMQDE